MVDGDCGMRSAQDQSVRVGSLEDIVWTSNTFSYKLGIELFTTIAGDVPQFYRNLAWQGRIVVVVFPIQDPNPPPRNLLRRSC